MLQNNESTFFNTDSYILPGLIPNNENNLDYSQQVLSSAEPLPTEEEILRISSQITDNSEAPILQEAELKFVDDNGDPFQDNEPILFLTADNALIDPDDLPTPIGSRLEDLQAKFYLGSQVYETPVLPELSQQLENNQTEIAVKVPTTVPLGSSQITLTNSGTRNISRPR